MGSFYKSIDTVLMGRKTYDIALKFRQKSYAQKENYVFSRTPHPSRTPNIEFVSKEVGEFARKLRSAEGKDIWLVGGAELIAAFLDEGQIDEFILHVIPTFIGEGIPLVHPRHRSVPLALLSCRPFSDGVVRLHYRVLRQTSRKTTLRKAAREKRPRG